MEVLSTGSRWRMNNLGIISPQEPKRARKK
jgi:hypothetical protein